MITLRIVILYLLQFGEVALIDLVECLILPVLNRFVSGREGVIDLKGC